MTVRIDRVTTTGLRTLAAISMLGLMACNYIGDPWDSNDPQWKQQHFASQTPTDALHQRVLQIQTDR
jgi:hypothetical protein